MRTEDVISTMKDAVIESAKTTGIPASLSMAQLILESGNMGTEICKKCNNLFGIKGSYKGQSVLLNTQEYTNGVLITVPQKFRKYPTLQESITDHAEMLARMPRYANIVGCADYKTACRNIQNDGYATDPNYADKLIHIIDQYNLDELDKPETDFPYMVKVTISNLRLRDNPNGNILKYCPVGSYHIIEEQNVAGHLWGYLQSKSGWIALDVNGVSRV